MFLQLDTWKKQVNKWPFIILILWVFFVANPNHSLATVDKLDISGSLENGFRLYDLNPDFTLYKYPETEELITQRLKLKYNLDDNWEIKYKGTAFWSNNTTGHSMDNADNYYKINNFYIEGNANENLFVALGKQRIAWGEALVWNPTDFLDPAKSIFDLKNSDTGVRALRLDYQIESYTFTSVNLFTNLFKNHQNALKFKNIMGASQYAIAYTFGENIRSKYGVDFALTYLKDHIVYAEAAGQTGSDIKTEQDKNYYSYVLGWNYSVPGESNTMFRVEYFHNDEGFNSWQDYLISATTNPVVANLPQAGIMSDYIYVGLNHDLISRCQLQGLLVYDIKDQSFMIIPLISYNIKDNIYLDTKFYLTGGNNSLSEFKQLPFREALESVLKIYF
ncbi:MAG: hypothetical protein FD145_555 [Candidatus Saganbacteria bacterium]|uniref:Alginate export domain-containing protein n=1 Tax=Candidatus Saganbacteria bacterium TaxID=2575572 RepID=A0A833NX99_UNCSA|nr:MAG: hypothetical protein FD145_555 [Candidatus Saganbacteria bacterium]